MKKNIYFFLENLSALLESGLPILESLHAIEQETDSIRMKPLIKDMRKFVESGLSFSEALHSLKMLPEHIISLIEVGEQSGRLHTNLEIVVLQQEKELEFRSKIRSSLTYAVIVVVLAIVVGSATAIFTLPRLADFFNELDAELPLITQWIITMGTFLGRYGYIVFPLFFLSICIIIYFLFSFPKTKFIGHSLLFHTPIIKRLIRHAEIARCGFLFGTMLNAGMTALESLRALPDTTTFQNYKRLYIYIYKKVEEGESLYDSLKSAKKIDALVPAAVRQMVSVAEQSGTLADTWLRIGVLYEKKVDSLAKNLPTIIEPIVILFVGVIVALLAVGTILPIYNLSYIL